MVVSIPVHPHDHGGLWPELPQNCTFTNISVLQFLGLRRPKELSWVVRAQGLSRGRISEGSAGHVLATGRLHPHTTRHRPPQSQRSGGAGRTHHQRDTLLSHHIPLARSGAPSPARTHGRGSGALLFQGRNIKTIGGHIFKPSGLPLPSGRSPNSPEEASAGFPPMPQRLGLALSQGWNWLTRGHVSAWGPARRDCSDSFLIFVTVIFK